MTGFPATDARTVNVAQLAEEALWLELALTPKPGLVDRLSNGAHRDMDHATFARSITAIAPWLARFSELGEKHADEPAERQLARVRPLGMACEQAMYAATDGVNTHKGGIFALGLLCLAAGRVRDVSAYSLCREVSQICCGIVERELSGRLDGYSNVSARLPCGVTDPLRQQPAVRTEITAGERQYRQYGLTGARGEVQSGFATVRAVLPQWNRQPLHDLLLHLMAVNQDSNLVARGGPEGLRYVQRYAQSLLTHGWDHAALAKMDRALTARNLSPGGSADLLSVAWVLSRCG